MFLYLAAKFDLNSPLYRLFNLLQSVNANSVSPSGNGHHDSSLFHDHDAFESNPSHKGIGLDGRWRR